MGVLITACSDDIQPVQGSSYIKFIGGARNETAAAIVPTADGGFVIAGGSSSVREGEDKDFFVAKVDAFGDGIWSQHLGGIGDDEALDVKENGDRIFVLGYTTDVEADSTDFLLYELAPDGALSDSVVLGKPDRSEKGTSINFTPEGNLLLAGNILNEEDGFDMQLFRLNADKETERDVNVGYAFSTDTLRLIEQIEEDRFLWYGTLKPVDTELPSDIRVAITDAFGNTINDIFFGSENDFNEIAGGIVQAEDGKYVIAGTQEAAGSTDIYVAKATLSTMVTTPDWVRTIELPEIQRGANIASTNDGGYIIVGTTTVSNNNEDIILVKIDSEGN
ncbi:MAG: hypothetical protein AAF734_02940, partial [Bacteroidota bacterium]